MADKSARRDTVLLICLGLGGLLILTVLAVAIVKAAIAL